MGLTLKIENMPSLPDGGPLTYSIQGKRGLDIGRDQYLDWTLPDPGRFISGKHCEVRWHDGGYWLHDVSTNGTFLIQTHFLSKSSVSHSKVLRYEVFLWSTG